jgi:hypothetical protein
LKAEVVPLLTGQYPPSWGIWLIMRPDEAVAMLKGFKVDQTRPWHTIGLQVWDTGLGDIWIAFTYNATEQEKADLRAFIDDHR